MNKCMLVSAVAAVSVSLSAAASVPAGFTDDFDAALAAAKKSGKQVYAVFSGSDWCHWCKVFEADYLSKKEFVDVASRHFELVYIDSPRDKSKLSAKAARRNPELVKKYGIRGFPSVKFITADGTAVAASRPAKGVSPKAYAESLVGTMARRPLIDKHITPVEKELNAALAPLFAEMMKIGNPFEKKTEAEQRAAFKRGLPVVKKAHEKMKAIRRKVSMMKVPAEIADEKARLLAKIDQGISQVSEFSKMSFEDARKKVGR